MQLHRGNVHFTHKTLSVPLRQFRIYCWNMFCLFSCDDGAYFGLIHTHITHLVCFYLPFTAVLCTFLRVLCAQVRIQSRHSTAFYTQTTIFGVVIDIAHKNICRNVSFWPKVTIALLCSTPQNCMHTLK